MNSCSNINWARRVECNQCKTPKPGLESTLGSRDGRGGGYLERDEVIEYRKTRETEKDEEWDEFGRKRKKKKQEDSDNVNNHEAEKPKEHQVVTNNNKSKIDEEEDEGDDDDR
jgi:hypothetical protein